MDFENEGPEFMEQDDDSRYDYSKVEALGSMDDELDELKITGIDTKVWLVKVPDFLAEKWSKIDESGSEIGKVRIYNQPDESGNNISILLQDREDYNDIPKKYNLKVINSEVNNMYVFNEARKPDVEIKPTSLNALKNIPTSLTGTIHHECTVTPTLDDNYQQIMRKRIFNYSKPNRTVQVLGATHKNSRMYSPGLLKNQTVLSSRKKYAMGISDSRMERIPRNELLDLLFTAFEKYTYWTFKGLVEYTKQPSPFLKEVLNDIAILNKRGPYSSMYNLKSEFRNASANPQTSFPQTSLNDNVVAPVNSNSEINPKESTIADQNNKYQHGADQFEEEDEFEDVE
ncbi:hypothetical protein BB559_005029 [Furculomyces boomerangus]|uniref:Transcription initiation factor IIF subunit beta n=2 Tax=Harpellales TaxID=61421 RepID=A0A2T9YBB4_9FUNG|nr:hypothetical protein BB559_005029 [Furculomyces boomerangus]PVZ96819.1 hypothetical protein BB558_007244 [Smittium angustum]